jgi:nucleotide-binding universal stress UspA family protein
MPTTQHYDPSMHSLPGGTLLLVTDPLNDSLDVLLFASELAHSGGVRLELLHVITPQTPSDERTSIRNRLTSLVRSLGSLQRKDEAILLFGNPEQVVSQRAEEIQATLVAVVLNGSPSDRFQIRLAESLAHRCECPVVTLPPDCATRSEQSFSTRDCLVRFLRARQAPLHSQAS